MSDELAQAHREQISIIDDRLLIEELMMRHPHVIVIIDRRAPVPDDEWDRGIGVYIPDTTPECVDRTYQLLEHARKFTVPKQQSEE
jgi:hypothetical protein